jgi:isopenicillin-N epimerase
VDNATSAVNAVLQSCELGVGDEILVTDHGYGAVTNAARHVARRVGAHVRTVALPYPRFDAAEAVARVASAITAHTRLAVIDHITSESALLLPLADLAAACRRQGVAVLADGAHAPGALALDIPSLGVDWYAANLHKWAWAPRSSGILWSAPARQAGLHPAVISWGLDRGYTQEFDWQGTRDPTPWLAAPAGLQFMRELGLRDVQRWNHDLAWEAGRWLARRWGTALGVDESATATMITVPLPARLGSGREDAARLRDALLFEDGIEVQLHAWGGNLWARVSAQVYNEMADVERLEAAVLQRC